MGDPGRQARGTWFGPGGRTSVAVLRIAIAIALLLTLRRLGAVNYAGDLDDAPTGLHHPVGLWLLLGHATAPGWLVVALRLVAAAAGGAMLVGWRARTSAAIAVLTTVAVASYQVGFAGSWSHDDNLPLLCGLAFLGARGGDRWSVDAWLRRRRGLPPVISDGAYQWSVCLVQLTVALMFLSGAYWKLLAGGFSPRWALSDNLRHQLLARFDRLGAPRTAVAAWLIDHPARYQAAAVLNLVSQIAPIGAVFTTRWPRLRAGLGLFFVIEVIALGLVMALWNLHWLPLAACFVDWDRLAAWWRRRAPTAPVGETPPLPRSRRGLRLYLTAFVLYDLAVSFVYPRIDQRLGTYPFSAFPMFSRILAKPPYDRHQSYEMIGGRIELDADRPLPPSMQRWLDRDHAFRWLWRVRDPAVLRRRLTALLREANRRFAGVRAVRLYLTTYQAPAYPAPAELVPIDLALIGELDADGTLHTLLSPLAVDPTHGETLVARLEPEGVDARTLELVSFALDEPTPHPLGFTRTGDTLALASPSLDPTYLVAVVPGPTGAVRYLLGQRAHRGW